ncbi:MAG: hypothetical protein VZR36_15125, partial [Prevotella sp.]|nr:hypothetical protein [Prevotella sp.]
MGRNAGGRVTNAKIQNGRAFCKKKRDFLPTLLRSENFTQKAAKPFVSGHFRQERKGSEIGRKIFGKMLIILMKDPARSDLQSDRFEYKYFQYAHSSYYSF